MEGDQRKQQRYTKRRERVHNKLDPDGGKDEMDSSPSRSDGDKPRAKPPRRRRNRSHSHDEDIIDGFAILSFKSLEDLVSFVRLYDLFIWFHRLVDLLYANLNLHTYLSLVWILCFVFDVLIYGLNQQMPEEWRCNLIRDASDHYSCCWSHPRNMFYIGERAIWSRILFLTKCSENEMLNITRTNPFNG